MLKFSEIFEFSGENSYFQRIRIVRIVRMVRMVRMVRSLADRTFQLCHGPRCDQVALRVEGDGGDNITVRDLLLDCPGRCADDAELLVHGP